MSAQLEMFARRSDPDSSKAAAARHDSFGPLAVRCLEVVADLGDATAAEVRGRLWEPRPDRNSVSRRLTSLQRLGLVRDSGVRRDGGRGVQVVVYVATAAGREWLRNA